jgi:hypothetical protein
MDARQESERSQQVEDLRLERVATWRFRDVAPFRPAIGRRTQFYAVSLFPQLKSFCVIVAISRYFDNFDIRIYYAW